jgi:N-methylhydantoinase A
LRVVSVERGFDPRDFTLVPFGGAGPLHACALADGLRIPRVLVPRYPGVLSALGMATAPVMKEAAGAAMLTFGPDGGDAKALRKLLRALEKRARGELRAERIVAKGARVEVWLDMRYAGQSYELPVQAPGSEPAEFVALFRSAHRERYGHADESRSVEVVTARVRLILPSPVRPVRKQRASRKAVRPLEVREVWFPDGSAVRPVATPFYEREALRTGAKVEGPAVIVQMDSTIVIDPGWQARADGWLNLVLERA